ncbi:MAG: hypothetical protein J6386_16875 [Candidatus Synoicihabitans palmerolidicus]|nr:hypothetical protein [Candidatus Synoicihabitans palmerolidicus]
MANDGVVVGSWDRFDVVGVGRTVGPCVLGRVDGYGVFVVGHWPVDGPMEAGVGSTVVANGPDWRVVKIGGPSRD